MPTLPEIRIPMPEEENKTLYGYITNSGEPPKFDDIRNSNLSPEEKVRQAQYRTQAYQDDLDRQLHKDYARMGVGTALSAASFHPFFNIPYVGTGIGGAMYDLGQGIVEGDTAGDLAKRAGRGFVIGETVGAIPYVGKALGKTKAGQAVINSAPVQAVGNVLNKAGEKFANSKLYDTLMTDIKAFNPNKQTAYHGSPYDFEKFSNEAIGTGEGAQAHGYGHYAALNKNIADKRYRENLVGDSYKIEGEIYNPDMSAYDFNPKAVLGDSEYYGGVENLINKNKKDLKYSEDLINKYDELYTPEQIEADDILNMQYFNAQQDLERIPQEIEFLESIKGKKISKNQGQLYKLSVPKDDVMLREGATFAQQPKKVQEALQKIANKQGEWGNKEYLNFWEIPEDEFYNQAIKGNATGKEIQNLINNYAKDNFAATSILRDNGIKGISYNGGIDGEARVIFNPDDIVIGRKYYNQPNLYEQLTGKQNTGALVDALFNR